jgi:hypothetical protein
MGLLGLMTVLSVTPITFASHSNTCNPTVTWNVPSGVIPAGSSITASITTNCVGTGAWDIVTEPGGSTVATGTFSCPCTSTTLFSYTAGSAPLTKGAYQMAAHFNGQNYVFSFVVSDFIVLNALPLGTFMAVLAPIAGLTLFLSRKRIRAFHL